ncbi:ArsR/SmtB family transcription factor [Gordonia shandongensis]|uniref:ArsR/SmtB family transcription factor n=1 Tax=Gordonia shandongensis TaxID=376351 RepID=UPI0004185376|nr:helix-turn-helix domain-containing protein [Gordonia shandongensis]
MTVPERDGLADLHTLLVALADPVRLEMVRRLYDARGEAACADLYDTVTKATASHHFKTLREAGIVERRRTGRGQGYVLRFAAVESAYPGLLFSILSAANRRPR